MRGTFSGEGSGSPSRYFDISHGKFRVDADGSTHISFDMKFHTGNDPVERFSGRINSSFTRIDGSIRIRDPELYDAMYASYHASVKLY